MASRSVTPQRVSPSVNSSRNLSRGGIRTPDPVSRRSREETVEDSERRGERHEVGSSAMISGMKRLYEEQKKLQASSLKIEKMIEELQHSNERTINSTREPLSRDLSALVHDVYGQFLDNEEAEWDYSVRFDHPSNKEANKVLIQGVMAVNKDDKVTPSTVKRALRVYFKSKKSQHARRASGKEDDIRKESRKRQRRHNKSHSRIRTLEGSKSISEEVKKKVMEVLKPEFMSSEDSATDEEVDGAGGDSGSGSEGDEPPKRKHARKKLIRHKLTWRNRECQEMMESLDRKLERKRTSRGKAMTLRVQVDGNSTRPKPDNFPDWATELFD